MEEEGGGGVGVGDGGGRSRREEERSRMEEEAEEYCVMSSFVIVQGSDTGGRDGPDVWHVWGRRVVNAWFW
jgi:hypothetical protein